MQDAFYDVILAGNERWGDHVMVLMAVSWGDRKREGERENEGEREREGEGVSEREGEGERELSSVPD